MDLHTIIATVGATRFHQACAAARAVGPHFGSSDRPAIEGTRDWDLAYDISELLWAADLPDERKMALLLEVYNQLPDYTLLAHLKIHQWHTLAPPTRQLFWQATREILAADDEALAGPLTYSLWCDFFEDGRTCEEARTELVQDSAPRMLLH